ncbi:MAG TPA: glycosyltransferase family 2 protein [Thermoplasmatales archaeon]|nr:glycosyltransferase family 2 protein [Thermoplasmatales archaeon]
MDILLLFLFAAGVLNFLGGVLAVISWPLVRRRYGRKPGDKNNRKVSVIIPSKGNIQLEYFEEQDYNNYEVIVVVDSEEEKREVENRVRSRKTKVIVADTYEGCSGKNAALLTGIKEADGEIFVFADDDIKPHKKWLRYLVAGTSNGCSTTYRWYFKNPLLCVWNAAIAAIMFYERFAFCWGGSTAIKRTVFEEADVEKIWKNEIVDDLTLTKALKKKGFSIKFVPQAMVESEEEKEIFKWMSKEFAWIKCYFPSLWSLALFLNIGMRISNIAGIIVLPFHPFIGLLLLSSFLFDFVRGWQEYRTFITLMEYPCSRFIHPIYHVILRPVASFIISYSILSSAFIKKVEWGGREYIIPKVSLQRKF